MSLVNVETGAVEPIPGQLSVTGLALPTDLEYPEWERVGQTLLSMGKSVMWWIGDWWRFGEQSYGERASQALESAYEFGTWANAGWVCGAVGTSRRREVLSFSHHQEVAPLKPEEQEKFLDLAEDEGLSTRELRQRVKQYRASLRHGDFADPGSTLGTFGVLYADPPWRYEHAEPTRAVENNYPTLSLDEIKALYVPAADDAVLFMWATSPKLSESMEVLDAWDFNYRTCMVWVKADEETGKQHIGMGYYARQQHELLLIAKRGEPPAPEVQNRPSSVVTAPRTEHSAKPVEFYDLIERMYPGHQYVELFARGLDRPNWTGWGNQA
jgi:N6-adenosine-specific RNA methylase IME4